MTRLELVRSKDHQFGKLARLPFSPHAAKLQLIIDIREKKSYFIFVFTYTNRIQADVWMLHYLGVMNVFEIWMLIIV